MVTMTQATEATATVENDLSQVLGPKLPGIRSLAVAWDESGELCVRVHVERGAAALAAAALPKQVNGVRVKLEPVDEKPAELERGV